jgi:hypothetical protein
LRVDTAAARWVTVRAYVGGAEAELSYSAVEATPGECRAAAVLGMLQLRQYYLRQRASAPVSMRITFRCGTLYRGGIEYDGLVLRLELRDGATGALIYQGRRRGFP